MNAVETQLWVMQCSVSFYRAEMRHAQRRRRYDKTWEIHMRLGQLNRDIDRILAQ